MRHQVRKHAFRFLILCMACVIISACGDTTADNSVADSRVKTEESVVISDERAIACTVENFSIALGEPSTEPFCIEDWAIALPQEYIDVCGDCESLWLFQWVETEWTLRGTCYQFAPITADSAPCTTPDGEELSSYPPTDVACALWPANTFEENIPATGCSN